MKQRGAASKPNEAASSPKKAQQPIPASGDEAPRWLSTNPSKRVGELFFIVYSVVWVVVFGAGIVATGVYHVRAPFHLNLEYFNRPAKYCIFDTIWHTFCR